MFKPIKIVRDFDETTPQDDVFETTAYGAFADFRQACEDLNHNNRIIKSMTPHGVSPHLLLRAELHFGILKGTPWKSGDASGTLTYQSSSNALVGDMTLDLADASTVRDGQLICYLADDGQYYSAAVDTVTSNTVNLRSPIESALSSGANVYNFYTNSSHPNEFGYYTIADYALRQTNKSMTRVASLGPSDFQAVTSSVLSVENTSKISSPSSGDYLSVTSNNLDGVKTKDTFELPENLYYVRAVINTGTSDTGGEHRVQILLRQEYQETSITQSVAQQSITGKDCPILFGFYYYAAKNSKQEIQIFSRTAEGGTFEVGDFEILRVDDMVTDLDSGKHVLFGDSWFAIGDHIKNRLEARLPNAEIVNMGVGGNTSSQGLARYDSVDEQNPDVIWNLFGTNDYFTNTEFHNFELSMNSIKQRIAESGAKAIFFDASVGEIDNTSEPQNFSLSRQYATKGSYTKSESHFSIATTSSTRRDSVFVNQVIPANSEEIIFSAPGLTNKGYKIVNSFFAGSPVTSQSIKCGFAQSVTSPNEGIVPYDSKDLIPTSDPIVDVPPPTTNRFITISAQNVHASDVTLVGTIEIEYTPN